MAFDDANSPPDAADRDERVRNCEKCNAEMKQLGVLPALSAHAAIKVYRCYACDHVVADRT
jgi:hypothetical protein